MSLTILLILNATVATILLVLLGLTMRLPFRLRPSIDQAEQRLHLHRPERAPAAASGEAGRRRVENPNLGEPAYSSE